MDNVYGILIRDICAIGLKILSFLGRRRTTSQGFNVHINEMTERELENKLKSHGFRIIEKERTMPQFGSTKLAETFFGPLAFLDWILPKNILYFGSIMVIVAELERKRQSTKNESWSTST
ncbi:MAG: hypothetical protein QME47_06530 [Candidatus Thermoplasmatota archaeon]|nr:hypothetical protein [Candidatus Thermoplasmatota archaeon]